jgi:hypothetical protein
MATTLAHAPHVEPIDSLEVRWIMSGELGPGVREWFERFPAETETREDIYLVFPPLDGLSLKFRAGRKMEAKCYLGSPGLLYLPVRGLGRLESWRKWSISSDLGKARYLILPRTAQAARPSSPKPMPAVGRCGRWA